MNTITNVPRDTIKPDIMMFIELKEIIVTDKHIIEIKISEGTRKPYHLIDKGIHSAGVYVRQGSAKAPASDDAIRYMIKMSDKTLISASVR